MARIYGVKENLQQLFFISTGGNTLVLYIQFTLFQTKSLQSPGTYNISKRTWDPSEKAITKQTDS